MAFDNLDKLETYEESSKRSYFKYDEHEGRTCALELLDLDEARPGWEGTPTKMVKLNIIVNKGDGTFEEYYGQWVKGAVVFGFFSKRKRGESFVRKLVKLPPVKKGNKPAWAFNTADEDSFNETLEYVKAKAAEAQAAVEALGDESAPWEA